MIVLETHIAYSDNLYALFYIWCYLLLQRSSQMFLVLAFKLYQ